MAELAAELRKGVISAINSVVDCYDAQAPVEAVTPYCIVQAVDYSQVAVKSIRHYDATITLALLLEVDEDGGNLELDNMTGDIVEALLPFDDCITVSGFQIVTQKVLSISNDKVDEEPLRVFRKLIRVNYTLTQTG